MEIDPRLLDQIEEIPDTNSARHQGWTEEEDAILLRFWPVKRKHDLAKVLRRNEAMCRERYRELTKEVKG